MIVQHKDKAHVACTECGKHWPVKPKCTIAPEKIVCFICWAARIKVRGALRRAGMKFTND